MEALMARRATVTLVASVALLGVAACASPEELRAQDQAACASYGFKLGTPDFSGCLQRESLARRYSDVPTMTLGVDAFHPF
jgi:hypothetical protein